MSDSDTHSDQWQERAKTYNDLQWVKDDRFLRTFLDAACLEETDAILDVGAGTGLVAKAVAPFVSDVAAIDNSPSMAGEGVQLMDARELLFNDACFDKVLARMVLHHITEGIDQALAECYRVLRPGGLIVIAEALPPPEEFREDRDTVRQWYGEVLALKEERLNLTEYGLGNLLAAAGFREIHIDYYTIEQLSVRNWLENGALSDAIRGQIWAAYTEAPEVVRRAYHLTMTEDDILINCRHCIITARRPGQLARPRPRKEQLDRCLPDLFKRGGTALYVGASMYRADYLTELHEAGYKVTVLDIWFANAWHLAADERVGHIIHGDVRNVGKMDLPHFDVVFWWHGPEHLPRKDTLRALIELEKLADLVVIGCPDGYYHLGPAYRNPHEQHLSAWAPGDFRKLGYQAESLGGEPGTETCHILAWRG